MTIAVDFDGCLCENKWPDIGKANQHIINALLHHQARGDKIILWTCREGHALEAAVMWCLNRGLRFDAVNDNLPGHKAKYGNNCRKVYADEYWDDRSVIVRAGDNPQMLRPEKDGGYLQTRWEHATITIERIPLKIRIKSWWRKWRCD